MRQEDDYILYEFFFKLRLSPLAKSTHMQTERVHNGLERPSCNPLIFVHIHTEACYADPAVLGLKSACGTITGCSNDTSDLLNWVNI